MKRLLKAIYQTELVAAIRLTALGMWWSDRAHHRLEKNSGEKSENWRGYE